MACNCKKNSEITPVKQVVKNINKKEDTVTSSMDAVRKVVRKITYKRPI